MPARNVPDAAEQQAFNQVYAAAQRAGLGEPLAQYRRSSRVTQLVGYSVTAVLCWLALPIVLGTGVRGAIALTVLVGGACTVLFFVEFLPYWPNRHGRLVLFQHGVAAPDHGRVRLARYDRTMVKQFIVRHHYNGRYTHTTYRYTLRDTDGAEFRIGDEYPDADQWGPTIQRAVTQAQLPTAFAAVAAGRRMDFGPLWITRDAVGTGGKSWQWSQVQSVGVEAGVVRLRTDNRWQSLTRTAVKDIWNFLVFLALAEQLQESAQR